MISIINKIINSFSDTLEVFSGKRNPMVPPARIVNINAGDAEEIGKIFLQYFIKLGELKKESDVLDVGSGFGRMAVPLTGFLSSKSKYEGLELIKEGVEWCTKKITPKYPNFKFRRIDVKNGRYNNKGNFLASEYKFPFEDEVFDFVILTSVFTHMLPSDLENYLSEIFRVLKQGGKCFITYFLLNDESIDLVESGKGQFKLKFKLENCRIENVDDPEYVIAYPEVNIFNLYSKYKLKIKSVNYGNWCGRSIYTDFQDIVVAEKKVQD